MNVKYFNTKNCIILNQQFVISYKFIKLLFFLKILNGLQNQILALTIQRNTRGGESKTGYQLINLECRKYLKYMK